MSKLNLKKKLFIYKKYLLLALCFSFCIVLKVVAQPVRTAPAPAPAPVPVTHKTNKPVTKTKTIVVEKNKDSDGDGLTDQIDNCPTTAGPATNNGCPEIKKKDTDSDGVPDDKDQCPGTVGPVANNGCPLQEKKSALKITSDIVAEVYVNGVLKSTISPGTPVNLSLEIGTYQIKLLSVKLSSVFDSREAYTIKENGQQDVWNVSLKETENRKAAKEIVWHINNCMIKRKDWNSSVYDTYSLLLENDKIKFVESSTHNLRSGKLNLRAVTTTTASVSSIKSVSTYEDGIHVYCTARRVRVYEYYSKPNELISDDNTNYFIVKGDINCISNLKEILAKLSKN